MSERAYFYSKNSLHSQEIAAALDEGGAFSDFFEAYEARPVQLRLTEAISECFNNAGIGVFEAGTGVGKSLAYLLPAMAWTKMFAAQAELTETDSDGAEGAGRVVISTATINLQQQLVEKDVPTARRILGCTDTECSVVLVKGRGNYVCLRRLKNAVQEPDLFLSLSADRMSRESDQLAVIQEWVKTSDDGSRALLPFVPSPSVWAHVCSESDDCRGIRCPHYTACFVMRVRRQAERASVLIVNHHLLFADLAARYESGDYDSPAVLPPFKHVVIDEAHAMTNAADSFFSAGFSRSGFIRSMRRIYRKKHRRVVGLLADLAAVSTAADHEAELRSKIEQTLAACENLNTQAVQSMGRHASRGLFQISSAAVRELLQTAEVFYDALSKFNTDFAMLIHGVKDMESSDEVLHNARVTARRLQEMEKNISDFVYRTDDSNSIFWIEKHQSAATVTAEFLRTPLSLAPIIRTVFTPMSTVIATSATMQVGESFRFWLDQTGLDNEDDKLLYTQVFGSPFLYREQVLLCIPSDAPLAGSAPFQHYVNHAVVSLIRAANGRTLVLFTSYEMLRQTCEFVRNALEKDQVEILQQGEEDRHRLLTHFKENTNSCLFGTASFWEGVDVPGESLRQVIIPKLPFPVPDEPVFAARSQALERAGTNAFMRLSVPRAVMQWRQGFGRLMRRSDDYGSVVLLDRRVLVKPYGKVFIKSIPATEQCFETLEKIVYTVRSFTGGDT